MGGCIRKRTPSLLMLQWRSGILAKPGQTRLLVVLEGHSTNKPDTGVTTINGLNAIKFVKRSNNNMERFSCQEKWCQLESWRTDRGVHKPTDIAVIVLAQVDTQRRNGLTFGFGWGDHFPWSNGYIYWRYTGGRSQFSAFPTRTAQYGNDAFLQD